MDASPKYTRTAMALHWLVAVLVFSLFGIGWYMVDLPQGPARGEYFALHKSIGLCVLVLLALRIAWRYRHRPPPLPQAVPAWQRVLAGLVHRAFYVALIVQPMSGYLSSSFSGYSTRWFGLPLPQWGWKDARLNELFTEIHVGCSIVIVVLVLTHVLGVVSHLLQGERGLLRRMLPW
ncbi:MAG: cytochrome b [Gammaproteobacteria bacterium]|nr:cytochrome b [Gammaproteobacteria bacterium]MCP5202008.1 cytochrome b [Gammaproteobacteria bacterium]